MGIKYNEHGDSSFWYTVNILMVSLVLFDLQILRVKSPDHSSWVNENTSLF